MVSEVKTVDNTSAAKEKQGLFFMSARPIATHFDAYKSTLRYWLTLNRVHTAKDNLHIYRQISHF